MPINLTTYLSGKDVTPTEDAIVYEYATNDDGIIFGCDVSQKSDNKIFVASGHGIFHGRKFTVLEETIQVPLTSNASEKKKLIVHMDLANRSNPIEFLIQPASKDLIQQKNLNLINGIYELELATFTVTSTNVTNLKQTFTPLKRGKPTVTVDDVVGLDTEITKLEEFDKRASGVLTRLNNDKADKSVAQMHKLTQDDGYSNNKGLADLDDLTKNEDMYIRSKSEHMPSEIMHLPMHLKYIGSNSDNGFQIGTCSNRLYPHLYFRMQDTKKWTEWQRLATIAELSTNLSKKADISKAQMHKLTQDDGYSLRGENDCNNLTKNGDYYLVGGQIKNGPPVRNVGSFVRVIAKDSNNLTQFFTVNSRSFYYHGFRNCDGGVWNEWQKLGGIDAKVYDIVFMNGFTPSKYSRELDNKVVVVGDTAHVTLRFNGKGGRTEYNTKNYITAYVAQLPNAVKPKGQFISGQTYNARLAPIQGLTNMTEVKPYSSAYRTAIVTESKNEISSSYYAGDLYKKTDIQNVEITPKNQLYVNANDWDSEHLTDFTQLEDNIARYTWYVGEVN